MPTGDRFARVQEPARDDGGNSPHGEDGDEAEWNNQGEKRNHQNVRREAGERDAVKVDGHGKGETDLDGSGNHREIVSEDCNPYRDGERTRGPGLGNWRIAAESFGQQPQLEAKLSGARRKARVAARFIDTGE